MQRKSQLITRRGPPQLGRARSPRTGTETRLNGQCKLLQYVSAQLGTRGSESGLYK